MNHCPNEFGIYNQMVTLKIPEQLKLNNGGHYTEKTSIQVDRCLVDEIKQLWSHGIVTFGCCCGHGINSGTINVHEKYVQKMIDLGYEFLQNIQMRKGSMFRKFVEMDLKDGVKYRKVNEIGM